MLIAVCGDSMRSTLVMLFASKRYDGFGGGGAGLSGVADDDAGAKEHLGRCTSDADGVGLVKWC